MDKWFRKKALKHHDSMQSRTVTAHLVGNPHPVGFYAMTMRIEPVSALGKPGLRWLFERGGYFPTVQLCSVAVQKHMQRQGIGTVLMGRALEDFYEIAVRTGIYALTLVSINEEVAAFYRGLGFVHYGPDQTMPQMLLPAESVIEDFERQAALVS